MRPHALQCGTAASRRRRRRCSGSQASIERTTRSVNATWGIYVKSLETGEEIAIDADRQMETMSTIKIPLMVEVLEQIKAGKFKLTDKYTLRAGRLAAGHRHDSAARSRRGDDASRI